MSISDFFKQRYRGYRKAMVFKLSVFFVVLFMTLASIFRLFSSSDINVKLHMGFCIFQFAMMLTVMVLPFILKKRLNIRMPVPIDITFVVFAFGGFVLGDVFNFYDRIPIWDSMLHALSGVIIGSIAMAFLQCMIEEEKIKFDISPIGVTIAIVLLALSIGAVWEIIEFTIDEVIGTNMQQYMETTKGTLVSEGDIPLEGHDALRDTMKDLILAFVGALCVSVVYYASAKHKIKSSTRRIVPEE